MASFSNRDSARPPRAVQSTFQPLMSADQCLAKADELAARVATGLDEVYAAEWETMAMAWRVMALQAEWQDSLQPILARAGWHPSQ